MKTHILTNGGDYKKKINKKIEATYFMLPQPKL